MSNTLCLPDLVKYVSSCVSSESDMLVWSQIDVLVSSRKNIVSSRVLSRETSRLVKYICVCFLVMFYYYIVQ